MTYVALPWFVLTTTGSPGKMVIVLLAESLPLAIFGIPLGAVVDRLNLKRLMVFLDMARGLFILVIPVLALAGQLEFWVILLVSALNGLFFTPYTSARMAMVPALVGEDEKVLTRANTAIQFAIQIDAIIGPALAGILIGVIGNINVIFLNAATFFIGALLVGFGVTTYHHQPRRGQAAPWLADLRLGLRFVWSQKLIRTLIFLGLFVMLGFSMLWEAALPVFVKDILHGDATYLGWLLGSYGVGSTAGIVVYSLLVPRWPWRRGTTIAIFMTGMVLPIWLFPVFGSFIPALIASGASGFFEGPLGILIQTALQTDTPADLRGRVFSAFNALWLIGMPIGLILAGPILEGFGAIPVMWVVAFIMTGTLVATLCSSAVRDKIVPAALGESAEPAPVAAELE